MKIARLRIPEGTVYASLREDGYHIILGDIFAEWGELSEPYEGEYTLLSPVSPSKVVCLGANYKKHAEELSLDVLPDPTIFLKPPSSVIASGEDILYPATATKVDYESELAVVIGKRARNVKEADALSYVLGYTAANDVTERNMQKKGRAMDESEEFRYLLPPRGIYRDRSGSLGSRDHRQEKRRRRPMRAHARPNKQRGEIHRIYQRRYDA